VIKGDNHTHPHYDDRVYFLVSGPQSNRVGIACQRLGRGFALKDAVDYIELLADKRLAVKPPPTAELIIRTRLCMDW